MSPVRKLKKPAPPKRDMYEQTIWDDVVRIRLGHGASDRAATTSADHVIAQRRKHGAP